MNEKISVIGNTLEGGIFCHYVRKLILLPPWYRNILEDFSGVYVFFHAFHILEANYSRIIDNRGSVTRLSKNATTTIVDARGPSHP